MNLFFDEILHFAGFFFVFSALAMGTARSYSLFTINQDSKVEEIHDSGKILSN